MEATAAGNHEFDEGYKELLRMQYGGCHPTDGCQFDDTFPGAKFPYPRRERHRRRTACPRCRRSGWRSATGCRSASSA